MNRLVEIRSYQLEPGMRDAFHRLVGTSAVPMLRAWPTDVVAFGPSAHEPDAYFLIRSYADLDDRTAHQDAFYRSAGWRDGPRESIVAAIDSFLDTTSRLSPAAIDDLRRFNGAEIT